MPVVNTIQPSFASGELSPFLYGRVDLAKFHVGCRTLQNFLVHPHGGASNRPGTRFVGEVDDSTKRHRLIPFQFRTLPAGQTYALVFGNLTMQVVLFNNGAPGFVENVDTMTITHPSYQPRKLTRTAHNAWTLTVITFAPTQTAPTGVSSNASGTTYYYVVTAISDATGEESLPSDKAGSSTQTSTLSWAPLQGCTNYNVYKQSATSSTVFGFVGQVQAPASGNVTFTDATIAGDVGNTPPQQRLPFGGGTLTAATVAAGGSGYTSPTATVVDPGGGAGGSVSLTVSGGVITAASISAAGRNYSSNATVEISDGAGAGASVALGYTLSSDGVNYYISSAVVITAGSGYHAGAYLKIMRNDGFISPQVVALTISGGAVTGASVVLSGDAYAYYDNVSLYVQSATVVDSAGSGGSVTLTVSPTTTTNPQCTTYYQQRQAFAGTLAQPQTLWFSDVGAFNSMAVSSPTKDSDAITRTLVGQQVNEIRHMIPAGTSLMLMTSGAEWRCWPGPSQSALTPAQCFTLPQTAHGSSHVPPIWTQNSLLFVKEKGSRVIELRYDAIQDLYQSFDMSILSQHLLYDTAAQYQIEEWALAYEPYQVVWGVRSDGVLLGFTFMREHEVYAWHRHTTQGAVESVCSITEPDGSGGYTDAVYLIVNRTVGGQTKRYVERMVPRLFATIADAWFLDCALQYSGAPVTTVSGLGHLEGLTVGILADGSVVPDQVVTGGSVTLDGSYSKVTVGLKYTAQLETLNLELPAGGTMQGQMKKIAQVTVRVKESRGVQVGLNQGALQEVKQRSSETLGTAMQAYSGDWQIQIPSEWNRDGRIFVQQMYPLPVTVLDLIPEVALGDR
jgi:hypothetical protein